MNARDRIALAAATAVTAAASALAAPAAQAEPAQPARCTAGIDQPGSGGGRVSTYGWNTCHSAAWTTLTLYRYSGGKYREVASRGPYWGKFGGKTVSAKCSGGGHWYVAKLGQQYINGQVRSIWSRASWLGSC
ncbi:hypothetical protein [Streptomyces sp. NPDC093261]|uniref:hypothetical protein n=1 Tax=Streptomyces sp. NPDC093261 TaxID=3366037 RepID=UPI00381BB2B6